MATGRMNYGTETAITITPGALANGSARESDAIDNSSNLFVDAILYVQVAMASGSPTSASVVNVWAYASPDGTDYTDNATGSDAAISLRDPTNLRLVGRIWTPTASTTYKTVFSSVAGALGGVLTPRWGIVVDNQSGIAFAAATHAFTYVGIKTEIV